MIKNSISVQRTKLRAEIKELTAKYDAIKIKQASFGGLGPLRQDQLFQIINSIGMRYAKDGYLQQAQSWLKKAEPIAYKNIRFEIIFNNNIACVYKKKSNFHQALQHLRRSQFLTQQMRRKTRYNINYDRLLVDCWLNLSALFSSKKMHQEALDVIKNAERFIVQRLESGYEKFIEQLIIAKYNKTVELEHLGKVEQAYSCNQQTKKILYQKRIYSHFLQKNINDIHQDLRKKIFTQSKHKRSLSMAVSLKKLSTQNQIAQCHLKSKDPSEYKCQTSRQKKDTQPDIKQNYKTISHKIQSKEYQIQSKMSLKKHSIAHIPITHTRSIMAEITNKHTLLHP